MQPSGKLPGVHGLKENIKSLGNYMTCTVPGTPGTTGTELSITTIRSKLNPSNTGSQNITAYYRNNGIVSDQWINASNVPTTGPIKFSNLYGVGQPDMNFTTSDHGGSKTRNFLTEDPQHSDRWHIIYDGMSYVDLGLQLTNFIGGTVLLSIYYGDSLVNRTFSTSMNIGSIPYSGSVSATAGITMRITRGFGEDRIPAGTVKYPGPARLDSRLLGIIKIDCTPSDRCDGKSFSRTLYVWNFAYRISGEGGPTIFYEHTRTSSIPSNVSEMNNTFNAMELVTGSTISTVKTALSLGIPTNLDLDIPNLYHTANGDQYNGDVASVAGKMYIFRFSWKPPFGVTPEFKFRFIGNCCADLSINLNGNHIVLCTHYGDHGKFIPQSSDYTDYYGFGDAGAAEPITRQDYVYLPSNYYMMQARVVVGSQSQGFFRLEAHSSSQGGFSNNYDWNSPFLFGDLLNEDLPNPYPRISSEFPSYNNLPGI